MADALEVADVAVRAAGSTSWRVLPESWAPRVSAFIRSAGTREESRSEGRPELVYSRAYLPGERTFYSNYNIRSPHFRCLETFFVEVDADGELVSVVGLDGLRTDSRVLAVSLVAARPDDQDPSERLAAMLEAVLDQASRYCDADRLRFTYVFDTSVEGPLGIHLSESLLNPAPHLPFREEARIPNETGQDREVVMLSFGGAPR